MNPIIQIDPLGLFSWGDVGSSAAEGLSPLATITGTIALGLLVASLVVATGGTAAIVLGVGVAVFGIASVSATAVDTTLKCIDEWLGTPCINGMISTGASGLPFHKAFKGVEALAKMPLASKTGAYSPALNATIGLAKFGWPAISGLGLAVDLGFRGKDLIDGRKNKNGNCS